MKNRREICIVKRLYYKIISQDEVINIFRIKESPLLECFTRNNYIRFRTYLYHSVEYYLYQSVEYNLHHSVEYNKRIFYLNKEN